MKTWKLLIFATAILLLTLTACVSSYERYERERQRERDREAAIEREYQQAWNRHLAFSKDPIAELKITAEDLYKAWRDEPARAKLLYQDKKIQVTGVQVSSPGNFDELRVNGYSFSLRGPLYSRDSGYYYPVTVIFPYTEAERLLNMRTNGALTTTSRGVGIVTIVGTCTGLVTEDSLLYYYGIRSNSVSLRNALGDAVLIKDAYLYIK